MTRAKSKIEGGISIIGSGNVAWHLAHAFFRSGIPIDIIISRNAAKGLEIAQHVDSRYSADPADIPVSTSLILLCVSDSAIQLYAEQLVSLKKPVAHTAASVSIDTLGKGNEMIGVFYPFQTFTSKVRTGELVIPICIEAKTPEMNKLLEFYATKITTMIYHLTGDQRILLHIAGIMANNCTNYLFTKAYGFLDQKGIDSNLLAPIVLETVKKLEYDSPVNLQTGPARRGNQEIIAKHIEILAEDKELAHLYKTINDSILAYYKNKHE